MTDSIPSPLQGSCVRPILHSSGKDLRECFILHFLGKDSSMRRCVNQKHSKLVPNKRQPGTFPRLTQAGVSSG